MLTFNTLIFQPPIISIYLYSIYVIVLVIVMANLDPAIQQVSSALVETLQSLSRGYSTNATSTSNNISSSDNNSRSRQVSPPRLVSLKHIKVKLHFGNYTL